MRRYLFAALGLCSLNAVAEENWKPFPQDQSACNYPGDKLHSAWPQLKRGFSRNYPPPDADWAIKMAKQNPKAVQMSITSGSSFGGKPEEAAAYAAGLQDVWRLMFGGDFAQAKADSLKLGAGEQIPAMFAQAIYAVYQTPTRASRHHLLEQVVTYFDKSGEFINNDRAAMLGRIYAKARLAQGLPIAVVIKRNYTQQIPQELDALLVKQPNQPYALTLYGAFHAGIIHKAGETLGHLTYAANSDSMEELFARTLSQTDDLAVSYYEYANALTDVSGASEQ
jgi:hypothetical protein